MSLKHGILGFLNYGSMTGYDLNKAFSDSIDFFWHAQSSQIYRELQYLEKEAFVEHQIIIQQGKPNKKEYSITPQGQQELLHWLLDPHSDHFSDFKSAFLMKVFFSANLTVTDSMHRLIQFQEECMAYAKRLEDTTASIRNYEKVVSDQHAPLFWELASNFGKQYISMCITWAEESIQRLKGSS